MKKNYILYMLVTTLCIGVLIGLLYIIISMFVSMGYTLWILISTGIRLEPIQYWLERLNTPIEQTIILIVFLISFTCSASLANSVWKELEKEKLN